MYPCGLRKSPSLFNYTNEESRQSGPAQNEPVKLNSSERWKNSPLATDLVSPLPATWKTWRQEVNEPAKMQKDFHLHLAHGFLRLSHPLLLSSLTSQHSTLPNENSLTTTFPVQGPFFASAQTTAWCPPAPLLTCRPQPLACAVATAATQGCQIRRKREFVEKWVVMVDIQPFSPLLLSRV